MITAISDCRNQDSEHNSNEDLVAVMTNPSFASHLAVQLYQFQNGIGVLQSTLTYKGAPGGGRLLSLCFAMPFLCALVQQEELKPSRSVILWNVNRGVVVHTISETDDMQILDMATTTVASNKLSSLSSSALLVLIRKGSKLYVHEHLLENTTTQTMTMASSLFQLVRKIKAGSVDPTQPNEDVHLAAHDTRVAVRNGAIIKLLDRETGNKLFKCKVSSSFEAGETTSLTSTRSSHGSISMNESYIAVHTASQIQVFQIGGKLKMTIARLQDQTTLVEIKGDYLLFDRSIYSISSAPTATPACTLAKLESNSLVQLLFASDTQVRAIVASEIEAGAVAIYDLAFIENGTLLQELELPKKEGENPDKEDLKSGKRPVTSSITHTLGPGQAGGEALQLSDGPVKKARKASVDLETEEPTIAERLKRLQQAFDQEDDDDDDIIKSRPKQPTTESLSHILQQALASSDDSMLELALDIRDSKVRRRSIDELAVDQATLLLNKLTARLAKKPTRAAALVPWIQAVLLSGKIQSSAPLEPLKNLVQERIEVFPQLLQLEGRLSMLVHMT